MEAAPFADKSAEPSAGPSAEPRAEKPRAEKPRAEKPRAEKPRAERSPRDMALSLLVLLVPVVLLVGAYRVLQRGDQPVVVDPAAAVAQARSAGLAVAEPRGLDGGWRTVSADFLKRDGGGVLRIGYLTPAGSGLQLVQSDLPADQLLATELTKDARPQGTVGLNGHSWHWYSTRPGERALVLLEPRRALLVIGSAPEAQLTTLAAALG